MNWRFCVDSAEKRALDLCHGFVNTVHGLGHGYGDGDGLSGSGDGISKKSWEQN